MRRIINSTYISLDGVVEQPQLWPTIDRPNDERSYTIQNDLLQHGIGAVSTLLIQHGLLDELRLWIHPRFVGKATKGTFFSRKARDAVPTARGSRASTARC